MIRQAGTVAELRALSAGSIPAQTAVVMTMGALHDGHAELVRAARARVGSTGLVIVTVFVNPTQFGPGEDFAKYPRTLDADIAVCADAGADVVFAPDVDEMYPGGRAGEISVDPGPLADDLEGASRPGHFRGVLTVVGKLLHMSGAGIALFGEKDYQQLTLIRAMVTGLGFPVDIVGVPTVRESDGLAMSSRNRYLSGPARALASSIPQALAVGQASASDGTAAVVAATELHLHRAIESSAVPARVDYVEVRSLELGEPPVAGEARLLAAVIVDGTRLIDNVAVTLGSPSTAGGRP